MTDTPESRLKAATRCGVVRDGHEMTMVRLEDVRCLCNAFDALETSNKTARERTERALAELDRAEARYQEAMRKLSAVREAIA